MGCSGSKADHKQLVVICRERRDFIRAAANYQSKLAFSHVSYFQSLKGVGDALQKFVDQALFAYEQDNSDEEHIQDDDDSHLNLTDSSSETHHLLDSEEDDLHQHHHNYNNHHNYDNHHNGHFHQGKKDGCFDDDVSHVHSEEDNSSNFHPQFMHNQYRDHYPNPNQDPHRDSHMGDWGQQAAAAAGHYPNYTNVHYMKKGAPAAHTVIQEPPPEPSKGYSNSYFYPGAGVGQENKEPPPPPSPPKAPGWDYFNPFDQLNTNDYYSSGRYGYGSGSSSSPDSNGVREREGIPDLEEETERHHSNNYNSEEGSGSRKFRLPKKRKNNGKSKQVPMFYSESSSKSVSSWSGEENVKTDKGADYDAKKMYTPPVLSPSGKNDSSIGLSDGNSSPEVKVMENLAERVSFEVGEESRREEGGVSFEAGVASGDPSKVSSVPLYSSPPRRKRDLKEAVAEIRDEFHLAAAYGKEIAVMMLKVGKMPSFLEAILSQILYPISSSMQSAKLASETMKLAKTYIDDVGKDEKAKACNLSSTLDDLYFQEKRLYKEVKEKEKNRILYEKQRKWLDCVNRERVKLSKIEAAEASEQLLIKKCKANEKTIADISKRINELRDEQLQPRVAALIHGLIRMWKAMLKCHQKQLKAVMEIKKIRSVEANTSLQTDPTSRATAELDRELHAWSHHFNNWIAFQKSYVESLNDWLQQCLQYERKVTPDGPVPYAPPVSVICNDWHQQMNAVSEVQVAKAMNTSAKNLRELWEKQDEEGRKRREAECLSEYYENQLKEMAGLSYTGVPQKDDLKVDLDSMWEKHREAMNSAHKAAWITLQGGLFPIFKALEVFTSEALKAHEHVRLQQPGLGS